MNKWDGIIDHQISFYSLMGKFKTPVRYLKAVGGEKERRKDEQNMAEKL